jgi:sRNA-binding protein
VRIVGAKAGFRSASSIIVRSTSSTALKVGAQRHDVLGRIHGLVEGREVHHAEHLGARQLAQAQRQGFRERQRAFAADQQVGEVDAPSLV